MLRGAGASLRRRNVLGFARVDIGYWGTRAFTQLTRGVGVDDRFWVSTFVAHRSCRGWRSYNGFCLRRCLPFGWHQPRSRISHLMLQIFRVEQHIPCSLGLCDSHRNLNMMSQAAAYRPCRALHTPTRELTAEPATQPVILLARLAWGLQRRQGFLSGVGHQDTHLWKDQQPPFLTAQRLYDLFSCSIAVDSRLRFCSSSRGLRPFDWFGRSG